VSAENDGLVDRIRQGATCETNGHLFSRSRGVCIMCGAPRPEEPVSERAPLAIGEGVNPDGIGEARALFWQRMTQGGPDAAVWAVAFALEENTNVMVNLTEALDGIAEQCDSIAEEISKVRRQRAGEDV
jgi:hypothetical protein